MGFFSPPGLDSIKSATDSAGKLAKDYTGLQSGYRAAGDTAASQLFALPGNGGLNPYLSQQFGREKEQIGKSYNDSVAAAQKGLTQRGMGVAPSGMSASIINTANRNKGEAETGAYNQQLQNQLGLGLEGVNYNQRQQQLYSPLQPLGLQMQGGAEQAQLGSSVLGNIGKIAGVAGSVMGLPGIKNLPGIKSN